MVVMRAILRKGLVGLLLAYVLAAQAMLAGPLLAAPVSAAHELCLSGASEPAQDAAPHDAGLCCLVACSATSVLALEGPSLSSLMAMRHAVPATYVAVALPSLATDVLHHASARDPPLNLV